MLWWVKMHTEIPRTTIKKMTIKNIVKKKSQKIQNKTTQKVAIKGE